MNHPLYDAVIIGGGFFGCSIAVHFAEQGKKVLLLEKEDDLLQHASYNNQARVHNGYHYPRSVLTALRSRVNFPQFVADYAECIDSDFDKYYAVSSAFSKVTGQQYYQFCQRIGADISPAPDSVVSLFNPNLIESVFTVKEYAFNAVKLKERLQRQIKKHGIATILSCTVDKVTQGKDDTVVVNYHTNTEEKTVEATEVFNCTYSHINTLNEASNLPIIPLKHELTEMALIEVPEELQHMGVTVMCGPFFSFMPFPARGLHTLSHVRYTPHTSWEDKGTVGERQESHTASAFPTMLRDVERYLPLLGKSRYDSSLWEVKTVLPFTEGDDARPILYKRNHGLKNYTCIMGGKIDNIYDILQELTVSHA